MNEDSINCAVLEGCVVKQRKEEANSKRCASRTINYNDWERIDMMKWVSWRVLMLKCTDIELYACLVC